MPDHIRFILRHAAFGFVLSFAFVGMLLALPTSRGFGTW